MLLSWSTSKDFPSHLEYNSCSLPQCQGRASSGSCLLLGPPHLLLTPSAHFSHTDFLDVPEQVSLVSSLDLLPPWPGTLLSDLFARLAPSSQSGSQLKGHLCPPPPDTGGDCVHEQSESGDFIFIPMVSSSLKQVPDALQVMQ